MTDNKVIEFISRKLRKELGDYVEKYNLEQALMSNDLDLLFQIYLTINAVKRLKISFEEAGKLTVADLMSELKLDMNEFYTKYEKEYVRKMMVRESKKKVVAPILDESRVKLFKKKENRRRYREMNNQLLTMIAPTSNFLTRFGIKSENHDLLRSIIYSKILMIIMYANSMSSSGFLDVSMKSLSKFTSISFRDILENHIDEISIDDYIAYPDSDEIDSDTLENVSKDTILNLLNMVGELSKSVKYRVYEVTNKLQRILQEKNYRRGNIKIDKDLATRELKELKNLIQNYLEETNPSLIEEKDKESLLLLLKLRKEYETKIKNKLVEIIYKQIPSVLYTGNLEKVLINMALVNRPVSDLKVLAQRTLINEFGNEPWLILVQEYLNSIVQNVTKSNIDIDINHYLYTFITANHNYINKKWVERLLQINTNLYQRYDKQRKILGNIINIRVDTDGFSNYLTNLIQDMMLRSELSLGTFEIPRFEDNGGDFSIVKQRIDYIVKNCLGLLGNVIQQLGKQVTDRNIELAIQNVLLKVKSDKILLEFLSRVTDICIKDNFEEELIKSPFFLIMYNASTIDEMSMESLYEKVNQTHVIQNMKSKYEEIIYSAYYYYIIGLINSNKLNINQIEIKIKKDNYITNNDRLVKFGNAIREGCLSCVTQTVED